MGEQHATRTFKSGNSVALRLPKALGIKEGLAMTVREERGQFIIEPVDASKRKFNIAKVAGSALNLTGIREDDRRFEERALIWPGSDDAA